MGERSGWIGIILIVLGGGAYNSADLSGKVSEGLIMSGYVAQTYGTVIQKVMNECNSEK